MISTNLIDKYFTALLIICIGFGIPQLALGQDNPFEKLKQTFEDGSIFRADFHHQSVDSYTQDTVSNAGMIWVGERQYKVQTNQQSVVVDGGTSLVYDENRGRVIVSKYHPEDDDFAPSRILNGVDSTFTVQNQQQGDDEIYIRLTSDDPFAIYQEVEIFLSLDLIPKKIVAVDPADNVITTSFKNGAFVDRSGNMFELDYPESVEVIDMRN